MPIKKSWGCSKCESQFETKALLVAHMPEHIIAKGKVIKKEDLTASPGKLISTPPPANKPKPKPIELTYVYTGLCPTCGGQISTLEIDIDKKHFCIAHCNRCNKQHDTREVKKL